MQIFSIGHSTRSLDELVELLRAHQVARLADIRSYPGSRRHPHFARAHLEHALPRAGIAYQWMPGLGGHRKPAAQSARNAGWRIEGFRAYADHLGTEEFAVARDQLEQWAREAPTVFMCAEARFSQCHRQLLADALVARGWEVRHIESAEQAPTHVLTPFARVGADQVLTYPGTPELGFPAEE
jgi:uncharacterized protein (DUF488 family)